MSESAMMELHDETAEVLRRLADHFTGLEDRLIARLVPGVAQVMVRVATALRQEFQTELDKLLSGQVSEDVIAAAKARLTAVVVPIEAAASGSTTDVVAAISTEISSVAPGLALAADTVIGSNGSIGVGDPAAPMALGPADPTAQAA